MKEAEKAARSLGVSRSTVFRALTGSDPVDPKTREKIDAFLEADGESVRPKAKKRRRFTVGVGLPSRPSFFWDAALMGIRAAAREFPKDLAEVSAVRFSGDVRDEAETLHVLGLLEKMDADAYLLVPFSSETVKARLEALAARVPVAVFNDSIDFAGRFLYVGPDHCAEGRKAAELLLREAEPPRKILTISPSLEQQSVCMRINSFREEIHAAGGCEIVGSIEEDHYSTLTPSILARKISALGAAGFNCVYVADGAMHLVGSALLKLGLLRSVFCVGHEYSRQSEKLFYMGLSGACVIQDIYAEAYIAIRALLDRLAGSDAPGGVVITGLDTKVFRH